eukprot:8374938-Pyramimonas_sp.AAC.1
MYQSVARESKPKPSQTAKKQTTRTTAKDIFSKGGRCSRSSPPRTLCTSSWTWHVATVPPGSTGTSPTGEP